MAANPYIDLPPPVALVKADLRFQHIPELDGVRGIAAVMVMCHHLFFTSIAHPDQWNGLVVVIASISHAGGYGVDLFFVLSGFLITSLLIIERSSPDYYWNFYWKRTLRILPLSAIFLLFLFIFSPGSRTYAILSFFFLANFARLFGVASSGPFWTLAIEEQFYLVWPRLVRRSSAEGVRRLALLLIIVCPSLRLIAASRNHYNFAFTFFHCDGLALGALLACQESKRHSSTDSTRERPMLQLLLLITASGITAGTFLISAPGFHDRLGRPLQLSAISLLSYCVVAGAVRHTGSPLLAMLRTRVAVFFGAISYCLYIANDYMVKIYDHLGGEMRTGDMGEYWMRAVAVFATTVLLSVISRYTIEVPAMSFRKHILRRST